MCGFFREEASAAQGILMLSRKVAAQGIKEEILRQRIVPFHVSLLNENRQLKSLYANVAHRSLKPVLSKTNRPLKADCGNQQKSLPKTIYVFTSPSSCFSAETHTKVDLPPTYRRLNSTCERHIPNQGQALDGIQLVRAVGDFVVCGLATPNLGLGNSIVEEGLGSNVTIRTCCDVARALQEALVLVVPEACRV
jgi:hypothetical protein